MARLGSDLMQLIVPMFVLALAVRALRTLTSFVATS
jgi:hypothetical protein